MKDIFTVLPHLGVNAIFNEAQSNESSHQRLMKELIKLYQSSKIDFTVEFLQCLACCLLHMEKLPCYERSLEFAAKYCIYHENSLNEDSLLLKVLRFICEHHSSKSPAVRYRCCDFIYKILNCKGEQAMIEDEVFVQIAETMLERLQDKVPSIRAQAVLALQRLQDPYATNCSIITAYLFHMEHDPSAVVRASVVKNVAVTRRTLSVIFGRIYDVKVAVRKEAILALYRVKVQALTIKWRQKILEVGFNEKEEVVKKCISRLISKWFKNCNDNFLELLKIVDVETLVEEIVHFLLHQLFSQQPTLSLVELVKNLQTKEKLVPLDKLTPEVGALWLAVVKYFEKPSEDDNDLDHVSEILPELTRFTKYIKAFSAQLSKDCKVKQYIMIQLIKLASTFSLSDEMGREQLKQVYSMLLTDNNVESEMVPVIVKHLEDVVPSVDDRAIMLAEIISDIREPLQDCTESLSLENNSEDVEVVQAQNGIVPDPVENEIETRKEPEVLIKCLSIVIEFLKGKDVTEINGTLLSLKDHFVMACFKEDNVRVADLAQEALALMCVWNSKLAQDNIVNFCIQIAFSESVTTSLVESLFDILLVHGFNAFKYGFSETGCDQVASSGTLTNFASDTTLTTPVMRNVIPNLVILLHSDIPGMRATVSQGLAKLLLASHISSPLVLANLILIWFSPITEKEPLVRQPLGVFFSVFSRKRPGASEVIINTVIPALKSLDELSDDEKYFEINHLSVAKLLVSLIRHDVAGTPSQGGSYHYRLAVIIYEELHRITGSALVAVLAKTLLFLVFQPEDRILMPNLLTMVQKSIKRMRRYWEKRVVKLIETFHTKIKQFIHPNENTENKVSEEENDNPDFRSQSNIDKEREQNQMETIEEEVAEDVDMFIEHNIHESNDEDLRNVKNKNQRFRVKKSNDSNKETSDNNSSENEEPQEIAIISETSASSCEDEDDSPIKTFINSNKNSVRFDKLSSSEQKVSSPRVLRSGRKRKSK